VPLFVLATFDQKQCKFRIPRTHSVIYLQQHARIASRLRLQLAGTADSDGIGIGRTCGRNGFDES
jgi:hypothetical protein